MSMKTKHEAKVIKEGKKEENKGIQIGTLSEDVAKLVEPKVEAKAKRPQVEHVLKGRGTVLSVLERAAEECSFLSQLSDNPQQALDEYYTLTPEQKAAIASGDIRKIEEWVGKLDERQATWLWCRLSQEKW
jgi:hypothetical protein